MPHATPDGWGSWQRRVVPLKPYRGRHPGPGQRKERLAIFAVMSRFRPGKALVRISAHFLWGHDAISFAIMTPPTSKNAYPGKKVRHATICGGISRPAKSCRSFANTEIAKDHVQNILYIDPSGQPAEPHGRRSQIFGYQVLASILALAQSPIERRDRLLERLAMARPGDDGRLGLCEIPVRVGRQRRDEGIDTRALNCRNGKRTINGFY